MKRNDKKARAARLTWTPRNPWEEWFNPAETLRTREFSSDTDHASSWDEMSRVHREMSSFKQTRGRRMSRCTAEDVAWKLPDAPSSLRPDFDDSAHRALVEELRLEAMERQLLEPSHRMNDRSRALPPTRVLLTVAGVTTVLGLLMIGVLSHSVNRPTVAAALPQSAIARTIGVTV